MPPRGISVHIGDRPMRAPELGYSAPLDGLPSMFCSTVLHCIQYPSHAFVHIPGMLQMSASDDPAGTPHGRTSPFRHFVTLCSPSFPVSAGPLRLSRSGPAGPLPAASRDSGSVSLTREGKNTKRRSFRRLSCLTANPRLCPSYHRQPLCRRQTSPRPPTTGIPVPPTR